MHHEGARGGEKYSEAPMAKKNVHDQLKIFEGIMNIIMLFNGDVQKTRL